MKTRHNCLAASVLSLCPECTQRIHSLCSLSLFQHQDEARERHRDVTPLPGHRGRLGLGEVHLRRRKTGQGKAFTSHPQR